MRRTSSLWVGLLAMLANGVWACGKSSPTQPAPACTYTLSSSSLSFDASGGTNSVTVTTESNCAWSATSDRGWMTITSGTSGSGSGTVNVSLTPNPNETGRSGTLAIANQSVSVHQGGLGVCTIEVSPASASFSKDDAKGSFTVSAAGHCQWSATSSATWLKVTAGGAGSGNGIVSYSVDRNRERASRTGTIRIGDRTFTVTQAADTPPAPLCEYSVTPVEFLPCMSASYTMTATISTQQSCTWTAESNASWITVTGGQSGNGPGVISFRVSDNWDAPRQSVVKVRWPTATAGQNLQVRQAGCRYSVSTSTINVGASGGPGRFDVIQQSEPYTCGGPTQNACMWTAQPDVPWITVTTTMPQAGDNPVSFTVAANESASARSGRIVVRDTVVQITQSGK